jgi:glycerophosphoryl diester phosphodiesterase
VSHFRKWPWPRVVAHRGGGSLAPENTLAAIRVGIEFGFLAVEFDAMLPADEVPVLMHDPTLERTTGARGGVDNRTSSELTKLDAGRWHSAAFAGETVPTLAAALVLCRANGVWPNVEIKPVPGHEQRTGQVVARQVARIYADALPSGGDDAGATDARAPLLSSFSVEAIEAARAAAPSIPRALLVDRVPGDWLQMLERLGCVSLHANHRTLDAALARRVKEAGYWLFCYTVNQPARAAEIISWGADAICTDRIDLIGAEDFA